MPGERRREAPGSGALMKNPGRRDFLRQSAGVLGADALSLLPPAIRRALAVEAKVETGTILDVRHIVILMQENRSFDHYFGTLRGVRGFGDRFPIPLESGKPVWFQSDGEREISPYHLDSQTTSALLVPDMPHTLSNAQAAWNQGKFGEWPLFKTDYSMGHYQRDDIPFQFALAEAFTICDAYHCSVTSGTDPNRIVLFSGSNFDPTFGRSGINCTDENAEPNNWRCGVAGTLPHPGYFYYGTPFTWPTLPELLDAAGIGWRIYQNPNNNWSGLMHGGLAFESFRRANAYSGSVLYEKGMRLWTLEDLASDVQNGTLPSVSWVLPSRLQSEHPGASSPPEGGDFTTQLLEAITANTESWRQTVLFLTFEENDGFFDHVPPPAVPSYNADGTLAGASTLPLKGEYFSDPDRRHLNPKDTISGSVRPWDLGARVPMYIVSPWSKGGWVNSQVFDHTSVGMFLERRFGITVASISPWHRAVCGDLTSAFDFATPNDAAMPTLPDVSNYAAIEVQQRKLPSPLPPAVPEELFQEYGLRYSRALPYELHTSAQVHVDGLVTLIFANSGQQGVVFHVYDKLHLERIPRRYTVEAGKSLSDVWNSSADERQYELWVYSANGYLRTFQGNTLEASSAGFNPETQINYTPSAGEIYLNVHNRGSRAGEVTVSANAYRTDGPQTLVLAAGMTGTLRWIIEWLLVRFHRAGGKLRAPLRRTSGNRNGWRERSSHVDWHAKRNLAARLILSAGRQETQPWPKRLHAR
jgi:phospholipase C